MKARIISTGYFLPERILTNKDLEKMVDTTDEWITKRTGITERRIASEEEASSDMGTRASQMAIENAGIKANEIDAVICSTITPDHFFPSTACLIQHNLRIKDAYAFDLSAACSGFLFALNTAESMLLSGKADTVLVVAPEKLSSITDWKDRSTCVLFGDGAGAAILKKDESGNGIQSTYLKSDGAFGDLLMVPAGGSRMPASPETIEKRQHYLKMKGNEIFKVAVKSMIKAAKHVIKDAAFKPEDIKALIPHQANMRIINAIEKRLSLKDEQIFVNLDKTGNTSAASIAISLGELESSGGLKEGDKVVLVSFGGGLTWAGIALTW